MSNISPIGGALHVASVVPDAWVHKAADKLIEKYGADAMVEMLAARDEPLGAVRRQTVAVLFVDIVGFTRMAERMTPEAVVTMLR